jgi:hypothetical protein
MVHTAEEGIRVDANTAVEGRRTDGLTHSRRRHESRWINTADEGLRADGNTELLIELAYNYRYISLICIL